ncbi:hypothetical protein DVH05_028679 [Phytophthora capsici]|nr:hypothetical protein DVH05_028679 [Phytophthora capsici]
MDGAVATATRLCAPSWTVPSTLSQTELTTIAASRTPRQLRSPFRMAQCVRPGTRTMVRARFGSTPRASSSRTTATRRSRARHTTWTTARARARACCVGTGWERASSRTCTRGRCTRPAFLFHPLLVVLKELPTNRPPLNSKAPVDLQIQLEAYGR